MNIIYEKYIYKHLKNYIYDLDKKIYVKSYHNLNLVSKSHDMKFLDYDTEIKILSDFFIYCYLLENKFIPMVKTKINSRNKNIIKYLKKTVLNNIHYSIIQLFFFHSEYDNQKYFSDVDRLYLKEDNTINSKENILKATIKNKILYVEEYYLNTTLKIKDVTWYQYFIKKKYVEKKKIKIIKNIILVVYGKSKNKIKHETYKKFIENIFSNEKYLYKIFYIYLLPQEIFEVIENKNIYIQNTNTNYYNYFLTVLEKIKISNQNYFTNFIWINTNFQLKKMYPNIDLNEFNTIYDYEIENIDLNFIFCTSEYLDIIPKIISKEYNKIELKTSIPIKYLFSKKMDKYQLPELHNFETNIEFSHRYLENKNTVPEVLIDNSEVVVNNNIIVISRYHEDLLWIEKLLHHDWIKKILIINKGNTLELEFEDTRIEIVEKENIGREGGTYLDYIIENFNNLPEHIWFTQADPFIHSPDFLKLFDISVVKKYITIPIQTLTNKYREDCNIPPNHFIENSSFYHIDDISVIDYFVNSKDLQIVGHSYFWDKGVDYKYKEFCKKYQQENTLNYLSEYIGIPRPKNIINYIWSACFYVNKESILKNSIEVYQRLNDFLYGTNNQGAFQGYILERLWYYLFTHKSYDTVEDIYSNMMQKSNFGIHDLEEKKLHIREYKKLNIKIDSSKVLILEKNNKTLSLPGLDIAGEELEYFQSENVTQSCKIYDLQFNSTILVLRGHVRDGFLNENLLQFIDFLVAKKVNVKIYIQTWENNEAYIPNSHRPVKGPTHQITKEMILKYFGKYQNLIQKIIIIQEDEVKLIGNIDGKICKSNSGKKGWKFMIHGIYQILHEINKNIQNKNIKIINTRLDYFGDFISQEYHKCPVSELFDKLWLVISKKSNNIELLKRRNYGCDNFYVGTLDKMFYLLDKFENNLDYIIHNYPNVVHQEFLFYDVMKDME